MWRAMWKGLLAHRGRLSKTALAVALGVAFVAGTFVLTDTMQKAFDKLIDRNTEGLSVLVQSKAQFSDFGPGGQSRDPMPESLLPTVKGVPGVKEAWGSVVGYAQMVDRHGKAIQPMGPPTLGLSFDPRTKLSAGRAPTWGGEVVIDGDTAERYGFDVGDRIRVLFQSPAETFEIVGIGNGDNLGATVAEFDMATAQRVLGRVGKLDSIQVVARPDVSPDALRGRIAAALPHRYEALTQEQANSDVKDQIGKALGFFTTALMVFALVALFVGSFIIVNTFSILVAQRTREIGLLRAVGASRRQVLASVLIEALAVGLFASLVGMGLGVGVAVGLLAMLRGFGMDFPSTTIQFLPHTVAVSLLAGLVVTTLAAVGPARRATRVPPVQAMSGMPVRRAGAVRRRALAGGIVTALGLVLIMAGLFLDIGKTLPEVGAGALFVFVGVAMLAVLIARPAAAVIGKPLPRVAGEPGSLGRQNAMRSPHRTAATAATLMIGLGLVGFVSIVAASFKASATAAISDTVRADFILTPKGMPGATPGFSPIVADTLRTQPDVAVVSEVRAGIWGWKGSTKFLAAVDPRTLVQVTALDGASRKAMLALSADGVLVREGVAKSEGIRVGEVLPMQFAQTGTRRAVVRGIFRWNAAPADFLISHSLYGQNFPQRLDSMVFVLGTPGSSQASLRHTIAQVLAGYPNVSAMNQAEYKANQTEQIDRLLSMITALLGLSIIIAVLGIANTLALSIMERTRELGLLRAVGMSRRQLRSMVRWEAVIIAVLGAVLGLGISLFFGWALVQAMSGMGVTELVFPWGRLAVFVVLAALAGVLAAAFPARRAAKLDVLTAIATE